MHCVSSALPALLGGRDGQMFSSSQRCLPLTSEKNQDVTSFTVLLIKHLKDRRRMKKIVSLLMCCAFAISAFAVFPQAKRAITVDEAKELIIKMTDFENAVVGGSSVLETGYVLDDLPSTPVTDVELQKRVKTKMNLPLHEDIEIRRFDGEYGKASYWNEYFRTFFTDKYVDEELKIPRPITQLDGAVYTVDTALYISTPGFPSLIAEKPSNSGIMTSIIIVSY